jgi:hypothetical protein
MSIIQEIRDYKNNSLKQRFVEYIKDVSIPLESRWEAFLEAPMDWKEQQSYVVNFQIERKLKSREISWYDDFYIEKNETVVMENIIERIEEDLDSFSENGWNLELIQEFKEEILQKNIGSFDWDW